MNLYKESVDVNNLGVKGCQISRRLKAEEIDIKEERYKLINVFDFNCHFTGNKYKVQVNGEISGKMRAICDRCNLEYEKSIYTKFKLTYLPIEYCPITKEEMRLTEEDLEIAYYSGDKIEVQEILREQIYLVIPIKSLCSEDCKGLCSKCGANLNNEECRCKEEIDERWKELRKLLPSKF